MLTLIRIVSLYYPKPTASKAIDVLLNAGILSEVGERKRDRFYHYESYLQILD